MKKMIAFLIPIIIGCGIAVSVQATMIDRGGGLVFDTDLNVTWLQDLNYAITSGYDADGKMSWDQANTWAGNLVVGGYDDWRLPTFDPDNTRPLVAISSNEIGSLLMVLSDGWTHSGYEETTPFFNFTANDSTWEWYWTGLMADASSAWRYSLDCG
ncbi:MAG: hypothetical protein HY755_04010 [Nitrospirae bacterium]|nr:hypothetical protein [Nitrospirota bacterium]MBI4847262.1 hypothetical protein [Nitrospirota bacterium]